MKYKFVNEHKIEPYRKGFVILNNKIYTNPTDEILLKVGFKDKTEEEKPEYNPETQYLKTVYTDTETKIIESYEVTDIEIPVEEGEADV